MAKKNNIDNYKHLYRNSFWWSFFGLYVKILHSLFYKNIVVEGKENIPDDCPIIFAPNHQNALMDPLAILFTTNKQIVFLARADIFKKKLLAKFLYFFKILPVFRIRDGKDNLTNNDLTFDIAVRVLENKKYIGIFPEARHNNKRQLLAFKKGIPRLAFMAEEKNNFNLNLKIIPVGIYYSQYNKMRSIIHIRYGEAISVENYKEEYIENQQKAMLSLRNDMKKATSDLTIDIQNLELYDTYESIRTLYVKNLIRKFQLGKLSQINKFKADKITINALNTFEKDQPEKMLEIKSQIDNYENLKKKYKLSDQSIEKPFLSIFRLIVNSFIIILCLPFFAYGLINNALIYFTSKLIVSKIKDKQFHSSIKFGWAVFLAPLIYLIQIVIFAIFIPKTYLIIIYALSLPLTGLFAKLIFEWIIILLEDWRLLKLRKVNNANYKKLKEIHQNLILKLDLIINHWKRKNQIN
ncbi:MAG: 1-acyl-sn-glycerol-3-phosphate acyltransferase [Bacteroidales bacterium]|nr:1-acyl-sn-glycerol-3-phosphate acyltransferase [Bacteroidales bacterium]MCK9499184.1 1-acyl-sn-glycerol-3-phosphate acyltransferase [Bacteroidales bacterium]MDY0314439.1 1-acyl-sn-glycerol-3-phosphate acyltransferase [Bacteroidales bacterium]